MKEGLSEIVCIVDRSGSMTPLRLSTIQSFNAFVDEQRQVPGDARLTLILFDHEYQVVYDRKPLAEVPRLNDSTYVPRGTTALLDAVGRTIDDVGARLAALPEPERPSSVIVMILTDGQENASKDYTLEQVREKVKHQRQVYSWTILFLGASIDAFASASSLGIPSTLTAAVSATPLGVTSAFSSMSRATTYARTGRDVGASDWSSSRVRPRDDRTDGSAQWVSSSTSTV